MKVLIIGSNFYNINSGITYAFEQLGWNTHVESYDNPIHPFKGILKWRHKFSRNKEKLRLKSKIKYSKYIVSVFCRYKPDLVFIYNGNILLNETLDIFRETSKVAIWMLDSIHKPLYKGSIDHINHADAFFCFEKSDVDWYASKCQKAYFLPQACDNSIYYKIPQLKDIDILFVGSIYKSSKRLEYIHEVVSTFNNKKILIYGEYKPYYKNIIKWLFREKRHIYKNHNISPEKVNECYNRAKVVINIHDEHQKDGANPKVFEISGAGAYQVCDYNPYIKSIFPNEEIGLYSDKKEFIEKIKIGLENDMSDKTFLAQKLVEEKHTVTYRVKTALQILDFQYPLGKATTF